MDLDDLFGGDHRRGRREFRDHDHDHDGGHDRDRGQGRPTKDDDDFGDHRSSREHGDRYRGRHEDDDEFDVSRLAHRLFANKKLLLLAGGVLLVVLVVAAFFVLPMLGKAADYVDKTGVKGVVDRVWKGSGGGK
jgi:hypothetical protein